jgi:CRP-like cAMP-binding protein
MTDFIKYCNQLSPLDQEASDNLLANLKSRTFHKGNYVLKSGSICNQLIYVDKGLLKLSFDTEYKEFIMRFFPENALFTSLDSYLTQSSSHYQIIALETTSITFINYDEMELLCKKHHSMETFFRKLVSLAALNMMKRISEMLEEDATHRYQNFVRDNNTLLQRISLGDLSSYLGITQVSLSRIRAKK